MEVFIVPETGVYTDSETGGRFRYNEGVQVSLAWAVHLGMPGAELPDDEPPFTSSEQAWLEQNFVGSQSGGTVLLIPNPGFVADADGWASVNGDEAVGWYGEDSAQNDGSGSLSANRAAGTCSIVYQPGDGPISLNGARVLAFNRWAQTAHADVTSNARIDFYADETFDNFVISETIPAFNGTAPAITSSWTELARSGIVVPFGATHVSVILRTVGLDGTDPILFDNVVVWGLC